MTALPAVVLAHQHGMGARSYTRQRPDRPVVPDRVHDRLETRYIDGKYELRRVWDLTGRTYRRLWTAWYIAGAIPYRIYDVQGSTVPEEVLDDLTQWIADKRNNREEYDG